jgi:anaerobic glycerol-3-phosphate dehydrogenase
MMVLSAATIGACACDEELFDALCGELEQRMPSKLHQDLDCFVELLPTLPPGLRAMAATFPATTGPPI